MPPRLVGADDAALLEAAENPRTGEVWLTEPDGLEPAVPILADGLSSGTFTVHVGRRGDAEIFLLVGRFDEESNTNYAYGAVEVRGNQAFFITCPAPTQEACPQPGAMAADEYYSELDPNVAIDGNTFYDSFALPNSITVDAGVSVATPWMPASDDTGGGVSFSYGYAWTPVASVASNETGVRHDALVLPPSRVAVLTSWGDWTLLGYEDYSPRGPYAELPTVYLAWVSPLGTTYFTYLGADDSPLSAESVTWGDGFEPVAYDGGLWLGEEYTGAGISACDWWYSGPGRDVNHDPNQWQLAGTLSSGASVYVPIDGGNEWSALLWSAHIAAAEPAIFTTEAAFLDARALIEIEGPNDDWWMFVSRDASDATGTPCS